MHEFLVDALLELEYPLSQVRRTGSLANNESIEGGYPSLPCPPIDPEIARLGNLMGVSSTSLSPNGSLAQLEKCITRSMQ